jgi:hypothetical protein
MILTRKSKYGIHEIIIDDEDMELIRGWGLYVVYHFNSNNFAAKLYRTEDHKQVMIYLHRFLLNCSKKEMVKHLNDNTLDCRRINMAKWSMSQKMKYARNYWKDRDEEDKKDRSKS